MSGPIVSNVLWASLPEGALMLITLVSSHHSHNLWNVTCDVNCKLTTWQYFHHLVIAVSSCNETVALLQLSAPWPERTLFPVLSLARTPGYCAPIGRLYLFSYCTPSPAWSVSWHLSCAWMLASDWSKVAGDYLLRMSPPTIHSVHCKYWVPLMVFLLLKYFTSLTKMSIAVKRLICYCEQANNNTSRPSGGELHSKMCLHFFW